MKNLLSFIAEIVIFVLFIPITIAMVIWELLWSPFGVFLLVILMIIKCGS